jgi:single-strand DNA-binding protein
MSINRAILLGNVGGDPDVRSTQSGDKIASFSLATSESWKDKATGERKETTEWHRVVVFNQQIVGIVEQYVKKGGRVSVEGQIKTRAYTDRDDVERKATEIVIGRFDGRLGLEGGAKTETRSEQGYGTTSNRETSQGQTSQGSAPAGRTTGSAIDDDIPFAPEMR